MQLRNSFIHALFAVHGPDLEGSTIMEECAKVDIPCKQVDVDWSTTRYRGTSADETTAQAFIDSVSDMAKAVAAQKVWFDHETDARQSHKEAVAAHRKARKAREKAEREAKAAAQEAANAAAEKLAAAYETLGVTPDDSMADIRKAHKAAVQQSHPDKVDQDDADAVRAATEATAALNEALETVATSRS